MSQLTWSLVIPTYMRAHVLPRCIALAVKQTRPPREIVIIDASPDWQNTRDIIADIVTQSNTGVSLRYEKAIYPSSTTQRNQGISLATSDVFFLIDDDSLMYPSCAEEVMKVYEADTEHKILGVSAIQNNTPPDAEAVEDADLINTANIIHHPKQTPLRKFVKRMLDTQSTQFLPYDGHFPQHELPATVGHLNVGVIRFMTGSSMTFRSSVFATEKFNELLTRYAAGEDQDLSYRVSRKGLLVNAVDAQLCHLEITGGRLSTFQVTVLAALNPTVLQQYHASDLKKINRKWKGILWRLLMINFLKDLSSKEFKFQSTRGIVYALAKLPSIHSRQDEELARWYTEFQTRFLARS